MKTRDTFVSHETFVSFVSFVVQEFGFSFAVSGFGFQP